MGQALDTLKALIAADQLHHATYRNGSFRGYEIAGCVNKDDPDYEEAYSVLAGKGMHVGAYGGG